jgi:cell division protein FtsL
VNEQTRMAKLNLILLAVLALAAISLVTSQEKARKLFTALEKEQERSRQIEVEWGQLQLEQSTWAMHARVERVARQALHMRAPDPKRTQLVRPEAGPAREGAK